MMGILRLHLALKTSFLVLRFVYMYTSLGYGAFLWGPFMAHQCCIPFVITVCENFSALYGPKNNETLMMYIQCELTNISRSLRVKMWDCQCHPDVCVYAFYLTLLLASLYMGPYGFICIYMSICIFWYMCLYMNKKKRKMEKGLPQVCIIKRFYCILINDQITEMIIRKNKLSSNKRWIMVKTYPCIGITFYQAASFER